MNKLLFLLLAGILFSHSLALGQTGGNRSIPSAIKERRPEIEQVIKLFNSGTAEGRNAAYEMITGGRVGPGEIERPEQRATRYFYTDYVSEVLRVGDASDKELAAELLMSIAEASAKDKQSSRINLELWAMVERPLEHFEV